MLTVPREGELITSPQLPGSARVRSARPEGSGVRIEAVALETDRYFDRYFEADEFTILQPTFDADGERFRLAALAEYFRFTSDSETQFAVGASLIDPLPHQIDAVYNYLLLSSPIRLLLADDPGAGKTIMAGLLLKELHRRGAIERTLIVVPANLRKQWQVEFETKFKENFTILESKDAHAAMNPAFWQEHSQAIISVDLAKCDNWQESLALSKWDRVIVDEAHKMAAYKYGAKIERTKAYRLGEMLGANTDHLSARLSPFAWPGRSGFPWQVSGSRSRQDFSHIGIQG